MRTPAPESRTALLDAAEGRFAVQGFDATTIKEIAADAGLNSALLYYYFTDKAALYGAVVARMIERISTEMAHSFADAAHGSPEQLIRAFARRQNRLFESQPRFRKILGRELVDHDARHAQDAIRRLAANTFQRLQRAIAAGQRAGVFRDDLDPRFAAISLVSQTAYFHIARPAVEILLADGGPLPDGTTEAFAAHVADFTLAALAPKKSRSRSKTASRTSAKRPSRKRT